MPEDNKKEEIAGAPEIIPGAELKPAVKTEVTPKDDEKLEEAVDDIAVRDSDELLNSEDEKLGEAFIPKDRTFKQKVRDFLREWWQNPKKRWGTIIGLVVLILVIGTVPTTRYFVLNTVGVRSSASVTILDESTGQPLKNVSVTVGSAEGKTNDSGTAKLQKIKLGSTKLVIQKRAFATIDRTIVIGLGSNPLGEMKVKPVGVQYSFDVKDFLSDKPIEKAEASVGEFSAFSNVDGRAVLTIDDPNNTLDITIKATGYRDETITQNTDSKDVQVTKMVPSRKHVFVSKRSGKYDVYKIDVDGKNESLVLSGTGNEREDIALVSHPDKDLTALVSTRDSARNRDGYLLSTLTILDVGGADAGTISLGRSEQFQVVGWSGDQLVYVQIADGASASNPKRHRLITYNYKTHESKELASSNYFNDVVLVGGDIYYAPSAAFQQDPKVGLMKVSATGDNQKTLFDKEVWNIFRTDYNTLTFSVQSDWYQYSIIDGKTISANGPPSVQLTRVYHDGPERKRSLWIDQRDGKGVLLAYNVDDKSDAIVRSQSGLTYPARWLTANAVVYRINTDQESADYVINLDGGDSKKIVDVTNTSSLDRWYYY